MMRTSRTSETIQGTHREIRDVFALLGGRKNLDLYSDFANREGRSLAKQGRGGDRVYDCRAKNQMPRWALVLGLALPTAITLVYFSWLRATPSWVQQVAFSTCKGLLFALPVIAWFVWRPAQDDAMERPKGWPSEANKGFIAGCISGLLIVP